MQYSGQIFHLHLCKLARTVINLLTNLHVGKSSKGTENETWRCVKMNLNLDDGHDEK